MPGLVAEASEEGCHLYRAPFETEPAGAPTGREHACSIVAELLASIGSTGPKDPV